MKTEVLPRLNAEDKRLTGNILSAGNIKHKFAVRLQTVSHRANGEATNDIVRFLGIHTNTVSGYVRRYNDGGIGAPVRDKTRKPGKAPISVELKNEICRMACTEKPENAARRSTRSLAKRFKVSSGAVSRILRERGIKPHLVKRFGCGNDPQFVQKLTNVVGLYMNPPDNAIVLCAGGKSRIQAPERTAPVLPMLPHVPERQTVDYERHGNAFCGARHADGECYRRTR
jgi:transposase